MKVARFTYFLLLIALYPSSARAQAKPDKDYLVYVLSEGADKIALVRFGPTGARIDHQIDTGDMPVDIDGPHGIVVSPDRQFYYVTLAHGRPFGSVWKYSTKDDSRIGKATLGLFPATLDISPDGNFLFVVNFNLHGDMTPSTVSVVSTQTMTEVARIQTCTMPHGSRLNAQGTKQYSACMMDDMLVEIDTDSPLGQYWWAVSVANLTIIIIAAFALLWFPVENLKTIRRAGIGCAIASIVVVWLPLPQRTVLLAVAALESGLLAVLAIYVYRRWPTI